MRTRIALAIVTILAAATATAIAAASPSHREQFTISGKTIRGQNGPAN